MKMQAMMEFIQRFNHMDMSQVTREQAKDMTIQEAIKAGATESDIAVIMDNVFGEQA